MVLAVEHDNHVAVAGGAFDGAAEQATGERRRGDGIGHQPDDVGALSAQALRDPVGLVAEPAAAARMRARVAADTLPASLSLRTRDTAVTETPARWATSAARGRGLT